MDKKYLIKNAWILSQDAAVGDLRCGDILIDGSVIAGIGPNIEAQDAERIDGSGRIAIPGFVDAHRHNWESLLRCTGVDWTLTQYFTAVKKTLGPAYTADDIYLSSYLGGLECLDCGITTLCDWFHNNRSPEFADAAIQGLRDAGIRMVFGFSNSILGELPVSGVTLDAQDFLRVKKQYFSGSDRMMNLALATRGPQFETMDLALEELRLAKEAGTPVFMHVGDGSWGKSCAVKKLYERGLLDETFTFVHCNTLQDEEIDIIGRVGAQAVSCPEVELNMGHGFLRTIRQMEKGIEIGLGVDVVTSVPGDMFGTMRYMLAGVRAVENERRLAAGSLSDILPIKATDVLHFATQGGAEACKLGKTVGSITPGKQADVILLDTNQPNMFPVNSPVGAIVEAAHPGNVETVFVNGRLVKQGGRLLHADFPALKKKVRAACEALFQRTGIENIDTWVPEIYSGSPPER